MSVTKRVTDATLLRSPYSDKYRPANTPTGVLIRVQLTISIKLPTMALARPPPSDPGAGVLCVNKFRLIAEKPLINSTARIQIKKTMPNTMANMERAKPILLARLRRANTALSILIA